MASYAASHGRTVSYTSARGSDEDEGDFEERLAAEEDLEALGDERGLEETLERLGFGMSVLWRERGVAEIRVISLETLGWYRIGV
jgi:hypothetical protein